MLNVLFTQKRTNTKEDILKTIGDQTTLVLLDFHSMNKTLYGGIIFLNIFFRAPKDLTLGRIRAF